MKQIFIVQNLKCGGCANSISKALNKLKGVNLVTVDPDSSSVEVDISNDIENGIIEQKLAKIGYPLADANNSTFQKVNSYISCMSGKLN